jgi:hypothetical protein
MGLFKHELAKTAAHFIVYETKKTQALSNVIRTINNFSKNDFGNRVEKKRNIF